MNYYNNKFPNIRSVGSSGNSNIVYKDMYGQVSTARVPTANAPGWETFTVGGFTTEVQGFAVDDYLDIFVQTNHDMSLSQLFSNHLHWSLADNSDSGKYFRFQVTGIGAGIGESFSEITLMDTEDVLIGASDALKHHYVEIGDVDVPNSTVSSIYILRLTRVDVALGAGSEAVQPILIFFNDSHMKVDTIGSLEEDSKA